MLSHTEWRKEVARRLKTLTCPNSTRIGSMVLMKGPKAYSGRIGFVVGIDGFDYDWTVKLDKGDKGGCPCWNEELLLLPTNE